MYSYLFSQKYKNHYKQEGCYTIGVIKKVKGYGRGSGYNFVYIFGVNGKEYRSVCGIGDLSFTRAQECINKHFLVVYLSSNVHINRIYSTIPINETMTDAKLKQWLEDNPSIKYKLDSIPSSGFFWQNY